MAKIWGFSTPKHPLVYGLDVDNIHTLLAEGQKGRYTCDGLRSSQCWDYKNIASITWPLPAFEVVTR